MNLHEREENRGNEEMRKGKGLKVAIINVYKGIKKRRMKGLLKSSQVPLKSQQNLQWVKSAQVRRNAKSFSKEITFLLFEN